MPTETYFFSGKAKWPKLYLGMEDREYKNYSVVFYPEDLPAFRASGVQLEPKEDEDGIYYKLRRDVSKMIKGKVVEFGPPKVVDKDNNPMTALIGNGSKIVVKLSVYDTQKGVGHRLEAVRVEDLVVYESAGETHDEPEVPF